MAVELTIEEGRWSTRRLRAFLEAWLPQAPLRDTRLAAWEASQSGPWGWLAGEGSIRGCSLRLRPSLVRSALIVVRLNTLAGRADWLLAHALVRALLQEGGGRGVGPDGRVLRPEDLASSAVAGAASARLRVDTAEVARVLRGGQPFVALPTPPFHLLLTGSMLPEEHDDGRLASALESHLESMAARYRRAQVVEPVRLPDGSLLSVWDGGEALVHLVGHLGLQRGDVPEDGVVLGASRALAVLGARPEAVSADLQRFYLPELDPGRPADAQDLERLLQSGRPLEEFVQRFRRQAAGPFA